MGYFVTQTALNITKETLFFIGGGIFVASVKGNSYFCTGFIIFQDLEHTFQNLERKFQTLECMFRYLEYKNPRMLK